jgi:riboflavin kinase/FMN adenylyltransferase
MGFPTANLQPGAEILPPFGVYAATVLLGGQQRPAIVNLGLRPTVMTHEAQPSLEVHIFDWSGDLYGLPLEVVLGAYIRPEQKFSDIQALRTQIQADIALVRGLGVNRIADG